MPLSTAQTDQLLRAVSPQRVLFKHGLESIPERWRAEVQALLDIS